MCTLIVGRDRPRPGMLLLGANRDEAHNRPALPPHVLVREPRIVAGRDSRAGGTWLGVQQARFVAALLNRLAPGGRRARSPTGRVGCCASMRCASTAPARRSTGWATRC